MKTNKQIPSFYFYILLSIVSLLYIRYIEVQLDYRLSPQLLYILLRIYEFIAIPGFYFFTSSYISAIFVIYMNIKVDKIVLIFSRIIITISMFLYILFIIANISKIINIHFDRLLSIYAVIFIILGCLFALITTKDISQKGR